MICRDSKVVRVAATLASVVLLHAAGCSQDPGGGDSCSSDSDCEDGEICSNGICLVDPGDAVADGAMQSDAEIEPDAEDGTDTQRDSAVSELDASDATPEVGPDGRSEVDGGPDTDVGADVDGGTRRPLSCHEYGTCTFLVCDRFDYNCRNRYGKRTSMTQLKQLGERQRCMQNNCGGLQGRERTTCAVENCEQEWNQCGERPGNGPNLDCGEFQACMQLCNGSENPRTCQADCSSRATQAARTGLQNYQQCLANNCAGTEGRARIECASKNCGPEITACWGC